VFQNNDNATDIVLERVVIADVWRLFAAEKYFWWTGNALGRSDQCEFETQENFSSINAEANRMEFR